MSEIDSAILKSLETKLTNLVTCVLNKASNDPEFARQLEEILLSDSLQKTLREGKKKAKKHDFHPVAFLHEHGEEKLRMELEGKTDAELRVVLRSEGIRKGKELKSIERKEMIEEIMVDSSRKLKQGSSFLS